MTTNELFIVAARKKFRFTSGKGCLAAEDLFDLNLESLDKIAVGIYEEIEKAGKKSFIGKRADSTSALDNQLEIVKYVIEVKTKEAEDRKTRAEKLARKAFLDTLLEQKQIEKLSALSVEEIQKEIDSLNAVSV